MNDQYIKEVRRWSILLLICAFFADLFHALLIGRSLYFSFLTAQPTAWQFLLQITFPITASAIFVWLAGYTRTTTKQNRALLGLGIALVMAFRLLTGSFPAGASAIYMLATPLALYLLAKTLYLFSRGQREEWPAMFLWAAAAALGLGITSNAMLGISHVLYPLTFDLHLVRIDSAFGGIAATVAGYANAAPPWIQTLTAFTYSLLAQLFFPLIALLIREKSVNTFHGWRTMLIPFGIAWLCYFWLPATGPIAVFGHQNFPSNIPPLDAIPATLAAVPAAPRNAMPSMHLSGAIWVLMIAATFRRKWLFGCSIAFVIGTAWATLALGEHYFIDLVVALPFATSLGIWLIGPPNWREMPTWIKAFHAGGGLTFLIWMAGLRLYPAHLEEHPGAVQAFAVWSALVGIVLISAYLKAVWRTPVIGNTTRPQLAEKTYFYFLPTELKGNYWLVAIFFFSGFAGLVYEVVYAKALSITFGGTALASNTVLITYMGGMALGAWIGGVVAEHVKRPMTVYAILEACIGLYAVLTPFLFNFIQKIYVYSALDSPPDATWLTALRLCLGICILGVPTIMMGATLPLVFKCLQRLGVPTSRAIAPLYAANVLGAAAGSLFAGYFLLPSVGRQGATLIAAVMSLMVALYVLDKMRAGRATLFGDATPHVPEWTLSKVPDTQGKSALTVLLVGGCVTLALEVVYMHLLAVVAGNSVYAFGLMLATFLTGLALGSTAGEKLIAHVNRPQAVVLAQCGVALSIVATSFLWDGLASYMSSFGYAQQVGIELDFAGRELIRALVCALAMMPPAFFVGMSYPAAMGLAADWLGRSGKVARGVGVASGVNTLGNIAGVLFAGFWWLPLYGSRNVLYGLALAALALAGLQALVAPVNQRRAGWTAIAAVACAIFLFPQQWNYTALSQGGNVYFYPQFWGTVIDHAESIEGGLTAVAKNERGVLTLLTNGKFQGNNSEAGEMVAQESFALMPLLHTSGRGSALVIGYGTGMTTRVLSEQGFGNLDVAETSRDIVKMADKHFSRINAHIAAQTNVHMHYTDGRNFLLTQSKKYDLISLEITSIWFSGAANLYNRDFYELANSRLKSTGVLQQWVQLHHMRPIDFLYVLGSARAVFKNVWVYVAGGQGIIVASNSDAAVNNSDAISRLQHHKTISGLSVDDLNSSLVAGPAQVDSFIKKYDRSMSFFVSTDDNLYLEYATPRGNATKQDTAPILVEMLKALE